MIDMQLVGEVRLMSGPGDLMRMISFSQAIKLLSVSNIKKEQTGLVLNDLNLI